MRKTNAALLAEIERLELEISTFKDLIEVHKEDFAKLNTANLALTKTNAEVRMVLAWHKQMNQDLSSIALNLSGSRKTSL